MYIYIIYSLGWKVLVGGRRIYVYIHIYIYPPRYTYPLIVIGFPFLHNPGWSVLLKDDYFLTGNPSPALPNAQSRRCSSPNNGSHHWPALGTAANSTLTAWSTSAGRHWRWRVRIIASPRYTLTGNIRDRHQRLPSAHCISLWQRPSSFDSAPGDPDAWATVANVGWPGGWCLGPTASTVHEAPEASIEQALPAVPARRGASRRSYHWERSPSVLPADNGLPCGLHCVPLPGENSWMDQCISQWLMVVRGCGGSKFWGVLGAASSHCTARRRVSPPHHVAVVDAPRHGIRQLAASLADGPLQCHLDSWWPQWFSSVDPSLVQSAGHSVWRVVPSPWNVHCVGIRHWSQSRTGCKSSASPPWLPPSCGLDGAFQLLPSTG